MTKEKPESVHDHYWVLVCDHGEVIGGGKSPALYAKKPDPQVWFGCEFKPKKLTLEA